MNWKRGFRRIAFVLSGIAGIICAGMSIVSVLAIRDGAQYHLRSEKAYYREAYNYGITPEQARAELERRKRIKELKDELRERGIEIQSTEPKLVFERLLTPEEMYEQELKEKQKQEAEKKLRKLENRFWIRLSILSLIVLCVVSALVGGFIGFLVIWLIYKLLEWLALGFYDYNRLHPERT